jgi:sarcosine oxidase
VRRADVVVVGAGVMGSAAAAALAGAGRDVVVLDRFRLGHDRGSSHGRSRIFRFSYGERRYVRMAMEALPMWRELEERAGEMVLRTTGGLDLGGGVKEHARALEAEGAEFEVLDEAQAGRRFPFVTFPPGPALFQPDAGVLLADRALVVFQRMVVRDGGELFERRPARSVIVDGRAAVVETDAETYRADVVVVTSGGWVRDLLTPAGIVVPVTPTRETIAYFALDEALPVPAIVEWNRPAGYALRSPGQGIKAGQHGTGPETDPNEEGSVRVETVARVADWVGRRFPDADPEPHLTETCIYTNTADESVVLERHGPVVVGSACSGHGFKFAPWIGRKLAALAGRA